MSLFRRGLSDPYLLYRYGFYRVGHHLNYGIGPYERDWGILIIMDACRYDLFTEVIDDGSYPWVESVEPIYSCASSTKEWMDKLAERTPASELAETAYVSASAYLDRINSVFAHTEKVWPYGHNTTVGTVPPETMLNESLRTYRNTDADRYIFHFLQPHAPFVNCPGRYGHDGTIGGTQRVWKGLRHGEFDKESVWQDYRENLRIGLSAVETLVENVDGDVVITADHGNAIGESGLYGHPEYVPHPSIKRVPWATATGGGEMTYTVRPREEITGATESRVGLEEQLSHLGYRS